MKPKLKILPGAAIFFFAALTSFGQGTVKGKIHDEASNETQEHPFLYKVKAPGLYPGWTAVSLSTLMQVLIHYRFPL